MSVRNTAAATILLASLCVMSQAQGATIRVDKWGEDDANCGSRANPCETIQFAIDDRANPRDRVLVGPGLYEEWVVIGQNSSGELLEGLRLESTAGMHTTMIQVNPANQHGIHIEAPRVRIGRKNRGFTVAGATSPGYSAIEGAVVGADRVRVEGNRVIDSDRGIMLRGDRPIIRYNVAEQIHSAGIACQDCVGAVIRNNVSRNSDYGFAVLGGVKTVFSRNVAARNTASGYLISGIDERSRFQDNVAEFNDQSGFEIGDMGANILERNIAFANVDNGFVLNQMSFSKPPVVRGNAALVNGAMGFSIDGFSSAGFDSNIMANNAAGIGLLAGVSMEKFKANSSFDSQSGCGIINVSGIHLEYEKHYFGDAAGSDGMIDADGHDALCGVDPTSGTHTAKPANFKARKAAGL